MSRNEFASAELLLSGCAKSGARAKRSNDRSPELKVLLSRSENAQSSSFVRDYVNQ